MKNVFPREQWSTKVIILESFDDGYFIQKLKIKKTKIKAINRSELSNPQNKEIEKKITTLEREYSISCSNEIKDRDTKSKLDEKESNSKKLRSSDKFDVLFEQENGCKREFDDSGGNEPRKRQDVQNLNSSLVTKLMDDSTVISSVKSEISQKNITEGLDYFAQLRASGGALSLNPLEKAAVHAAQYLAMDPLEKMRRQVEQTLEAKLGLLQTKLDNARDPKNKTQRKVYVGNLTPNINGEFLKQLFTQTLVISYPQWNVPGQDSVVEVQHRDGNKYCFLELRTMEMATAALQINGVTVLGTQLQVSRSIGFLDPVECEKAVREVEHELARFRSGEDEGPLLRQPGYAELVAKIKGQCGENLVHAEEFDSGMPSAYLSFDCIVTASSLDSSEEVQELYEDVKAKVSEYGNVIRIVIPRPPLGVKGLDLFGKSHYGKVFVQLDSTEAAINAKKALHGMIFDGRTVIAQSVTESDFSKALGI